MLVCHYILVPPTFHILPFYLNASVAHCTIIDGHGLVTILMHGIRGILVSIVKLIIDFSQSTGIEKMLTTTTNPNIWMEITVSHIYPSFFRQKVFGHYINLQPPDSMSIF